MILFRRQYVIGSTDLYRPHGTFRGNLGQRVKPATDDRRRRCKRSVRIEVIETWTRSAVASRTPLGGFQHWYSRAFSASISLCVMVACTLPSTDPKVCGSLVGSRLPPPAGSRLFSKAAISSELNFGSFFCGFSACGFDIAIFFGGFGRRFGFGAGFSASSGFSTFGSGTGAGAGDGNAATFSLAFRSARSFSALVAEPAPARPSLASLLFSPAGPAARFPPFVRQRIRSRFAVCFWFGLLVTEFQVRHLVNRYEFNRHGFDGIGLHER